MTLENLNIYKVKNVIGFKCLFIIVYLFCQEETNGIHVLAYTSLSVLFEKWT